MEAAKAPSSKQSTPRSHDLLLNITLFSSSHRRLQWQRRHSLGRRLKQLPSQGLRPPLSLGFQHLPSHPRRPSRLDLIIWPSSPTRWIDRGCPSTKRHLHRLHRGYWSTMLSRMQQTHHAVPLHGPHCRQQTLAARLNQRSTRSRGNLPMLPTPKHLPLHRCPSGPS